MDKSEKQYTTAPMPDYISEAHVELQLHDDERGILNELYNACNKEGDEILNRMRSEVIVINIQFILKKKVNILKCQCECKQIVVICYAQFKVFVKIFEV